MTRETLRAEAARRAVTVWKIRNERRLLEQQFNGGPRDLVMVFEGEFREQLEDCPHCGHALDRRRYQQLQQTYLDCPVCCLTWSIGYEPPGSDDG